MVLSGAAAASAASLQLPLPSRTSTSSSSSSAAAGAAPSQGFYNGLLADGLHAAFRESLLLGRRLLQDAQLAVDAAAASGAECPATDTRIGASNAYLYAALVTSYVHPAFRYVQEVSVALLVDGLRAFANGHAALTAVAILLILATYWWSLRRSIAKMDGDMKRTRGTLLLFPSDVLAGVAGIMQGGLGMNIVVQRHQDGGVEGDDAGEAGAVVAPLSSGTVRGRPAVAVYASDVRAAR